MLGMLPLIFNSNTGYPIVKRKEAILTLATPKASNFSLEKTKSKSRVGFSSALVITLDMKAITSLS